MFVAKDKEKVFLMIAFLQFVLTCFAARFFYTTDAKTGILGFAMFLVFFLLVFPIIVVRKIFKKSLKKFWIQKPVSKKKFWITIAILFLFIFSTWLFVVHFGLGKEFIFISWWATKSTGLTFLFGLVVFPFIVISIEVFFRGFLLNILKNKISLFFSVIIQSGLYLAFIFLIRDAHNPKVLLFNFILGLILGAVAYFNRSVFVSSVFHWVFINSINFLAVLKFN